MQMHALVNEVRVKRVRTGEGTPCSPLERAHPLWTFDLPAAGHSDSIASVTTWSSFDLLGKYDGTHCLYDRGKWGHSLRRQIGANGEHEETSYET